MQNSVPYMADLNNVEQLLNNNHRQLVVLSGSQDWAVSAALRLLKCNLATKNIWIGEPPDSLNDAVSPSEAFKLLGQEYDRLVFNSFSGLDVDAFGAVSGTVKGGGVFILLTPPLHTWPDYHDPDHKRITVTPHDYRQVPGNFLKRLTRIIANDDYALRINQEDEENHIPALEKILSGLNPGRQIITTDEQLETIEAIQRVATGHRRRPLVITSDRGRGKSAALGMAAAQLIQQGFGDIIITASLPAATESAFRHASQMLDGSAIQDYSLTCDSASLSYISPLELANGNHDARLLLVDEAAAIPADILEKLLKQFSRIVFATTVHGYEGTGRGFAVRFSKTLDRITPQWRAISLKTPVRWNINDPLESFIFSSLMLGASSVEDEKIKEAESASSVCRLVSRDEIMQNDRLLSRIFGLLVSAHYRTRPFDLRCLLDCFDMDIIVLEHKQHVVGILMLTYEGSLDSKTAGQILNGKRWPQGHLLPEALTAHCGYVEASILKCARIMRIAVHPAVQGRGLGSKMMDYAFSHTGYAGCDYIGSSFGVNRELLQFWYNNKYTVARVSLKPGRSHGERSVIVLRAISEHGAILVQSVHNRFSRNFIYELASLYQDIDAVIAELLLQDIRGQEIDVRLHDSDRLDINTFISGHRNFNSVRIALWRYLVCLYSSGSATATLDELSRCFLLRLLLQATDVETVKREFNFAGTQALEDNIKTVLAITIKDENNYINGRT